MHTPIWRVPWLVFAGSLLAARLALAQGIMVSPVNIQMLPRQNAAVLTINNQDNRPVSFQIRAFAWQQTRSGDEQLTPTDELAASPPIATIEPHTTQVARLVLRQPPQGREATYRILLDQLSPPSEAVQVHIALRLSIPVFAEPADKVAPRLQWAIATQGGQVWLRAANDGSRHQTVHNIVLHTADGRSLQVEINSPPHILAGGARRWRILTHGFALAPGTAVRLTASADNGTIDEQVRVNAGQ